MPQEFPLLTLPGDPYQLGFRHGKSVRELVHHNIGVYFRRFRNEAGLLREEVFARTNKYLAVIGDASLYGQAIRGIADGAGCSILEVAALNVRYELMYSEFTRMGLEGRPRRAAAITYGCTAFAALPEATSNGHLLIGQNWDWIPDVKGLFLKIEMPRRHRILCFTEAGVVGGKIGLNTAGLGLAINGVVSNQDDWARLGKPFHVQCWDILNSRTLDEAASSVSDEKRSCSANFLLAQASAVGKGSVLDVEASPNEVCQLRPHDGLFAHTNHFFDPSVLGVYHPLKEEREMSARRCTRMQHLLRQAVSNGSKLNVTRLQAMLGDHESYPESICRHPNQGFPEDARYQTVLSVVMDLHARQLWAAAGPPCQHVYRTYSLK